MAEKVVLFLQGPPTPFWVELGDALRAREARVLRVNLNAGDALFWPRRGALNYRGSLRAWRGWVQALMAREGVTDVLYYADRLPYHRIAARAARAAGAQAHAVELGYLRPDWLTLERWGGGAHSLFPDAPEALSPDAPSLADDRTRYAHPFWAEAVGEVAYNLLMTAGRPLYPRYVTDKRYAPIFDYLCWAPKLARARADARRGAAQTKALVRGGRPFALLALQMQSDYQLRASAPFASQADALREVVESFARAAPPDMALAVKEHPLDNGWENYGGQLRRLAAEFGLDGRLRFLASGDLGALLGAARGVVTINSTVGVHALRAGRPVAALGAAVYAMPGLTHQGPLDGFWAAPTPPDPAVVDRFVATLAAEIQIKGSFYDRAGRARGVAAMAERVMEGRVGPLGAAPRPPRVAALRAERRRRRRA